MAGGRLAAAGAVGGAVGADVTGAGLGSRLANTWRSVYPKGQPSIGAAGYVWSKAPGLVRLYAQGAVIRSWERIHGLRLRFVYRRGSLSLLVADNARLTNRGRAAANIGRRQGAAFTRLAGRTTIPLFILVPQVTVRRRLDVAGAGEKWIRMVPQLVLRHWFGSA